MIFYFLHLKFVIKESRCCVNILKPALFFSRLKSNNVRKMSSLKVSALYLACLLNLNIQQVKFNFFSHLCKLALRSCHFSIDGIFLWLWGGGSRALFFHILSENSSPARDRKRLTSWRIGRMNRTRAKSYRLDFWNRWFQALKRNVRFW